MSEYSIVEVLKKFASENTSTLTKIGFLTLSFPIKDVLLPYYFGQILETACSSRPEDVWQNNSTNIKIAVGLWGADQIFYSILDEIDAWFMPKMQSYVRESLVTKILEEYSNDYKDPEVGAMLAKVIKIPNVLRGLYNEFRNFVFPAVLVAVVASGYMFYVNKKLGIAAIAAMSMFGVIVWWFSQSTMDGMEESEEKYTQLHEEISDTLSNMLSIFAANNLQDELRRLEKLQALHDEAYTRSIRSTNKFKMLFNGAYFVVFVALNGYALKLYSDGEISFGDLSSVMVVILALLQHVDNLASDIKEVLSNISSLQHTQISINEVVLKNRRSLDPSSRRGSPKDALVIENLRVRLSPIFELNIPHYSIPKGSKVAITGEIGSGKSTLQRAILGLVKYQGSIYIDGVDISGIDPTIIRGVISYIPQLPRLFNRTVLENILYGDGSTPSLSNEGEGDGPSIEGGEPSNESSSSILPEKREMVAGLLEKYGITQISPDDFDRLAGKNGDHLSGGQRQIIHLLRFSLRDTPILMLDEPTSALDSSTRDQVLDILERLSVGKTLIIITHDPVVMKRCDRVLKLDGGRVVSG